MKARQAVAMLGVVAAVGGAGPALATPLHAANASTFLVTFARSYRQCSSGPHARDPRLAFPACDPVTAAPSVSFGPRGFGQARGVVRLNAVKQASDVQLTARLIDVRQGDDGTGPGFDGTLTVAAIIRTVAHDCGGGTVPCAAIDLPFPVPLPCGSAAVPPLPAGQCASKASANAIAPGGVVGGARADIGITQLQVFNGDDLVFEDGRFLP